MDLRPASRPRSLLLLAASVACLVGCDHATKVAAVSVLRDRGPLTLVPGWLDLHYTENDDVAFNAFHRLSLHPPAWALVCAMAVATAAVTVAWVRARRLSLAHHGAFALVTAGALGNAIDRVGRGRVVDFIHLRFWPVFNVADVAVVLGMALLLILRAPVGARASRQN
jgi:signal peptidase II